MQRMEVIIRYVDDEDQVLSESNMSFQTLDVDSIPREERLGVLVEMEKKKTTIRGFHRRTGVTHSRLAQWTKLLSLEFLIDLENKPAIGINMLMLSWGKMSEVLIRHRIVLRLELFRGK